MGVLVLRYPSDYREGDVVVLRDPSTNRTIMRRVVATTGQKMVYRGDDLPIPTGYCWVEDTQENDESNNKCSLDSRYFGPVHLGLVDGLVTKVIWPPWRARELEINALGEDDCETCE